MQKFLSDTGAMLERKLGDGSDSSDLWKDVAGEPHEPGTAVARHSPDAKGLGGESSHASRLSMHQKRPPLLQGVKSSLAASREAQQNSSSQNAPVNSAVSFADGGDDHTPEFRYSEVKDGQLYAC